MHERSAAGYYHRGGRGSLRATGLPLGDPPPPGDNIYEWLHASEKQLPPLRTYNSENSNHDKYYMLQPGLSNIERDSVSDTYVRYVAFFVFI
jgi:hypothetical protein